MTATHALVTALKRQDTNPDDSLSIVEGLMADPVMRARVPAELLKEYDAAVRTPGPSDLVEKLIAVTSNATRIASKIFMKKQAMKARSHSYSTAHHHLQIGEEVCVYEK